VEDQLWLVPLLKESEGAAERRSRHMENQEVVREILQVVKMSKKLRSAIYQKLVWGQELRNLLNLPRTSINKERIQEHWANGTDQSL